MRSVCNYFLGIGGNWSSWLKLQGRNSSILNLTIWYSTSFLNKNKNVLSYVMDLWHKHTLKLRILSPSASSSHSSPIPSPSRSFCSLFGNVRQLSWKVNVRVSGYTEWFSLKIKKTHFQTFWTPFMGFSRSWFNWVRTFLILKDLPSSISDLS